MSNDALNLLANGPSEIKHKGRKEILNEMKELVKDQYEKREKMTYEESLEQISKDKNIEPLTVDQQITVLLMEVAELKNFKNYQMESNSKLSDQNRSLLNKINEIEDAMERITCRNKDEKSTDESNVSNESTYECPNCKGKCKNFYRLYGGPIYIDCVMCRGSGKVIGTKLTDEEFDKEMKELGW